MYTLTSNPSELSRIRVTYFITWFKPPYCDIFHLLERGISPVGEDDWKKLLNTCFQKFAQKSSNFVPGGFSSKSSSRELYTGVLSSIGWCSIIIPRICPDIEAERFANILKGTHPRAVQRVCLAAISLLQKHLSPKILTSTLVGSCLPTKEMCLDILVSRSFCLPLLSHPILYLLD